MFAVTTKECMNKYPSRIQDSVVDEVCTSTKIYRTHFLDFGNGLEPIEIKVTHEVVIN